MPLFEAAALGEAPRDASDRQFGDTSREPATNFPALMRAAHHYATRSHEGLWLERSVAEVLAKLPEGPLPEGLDRDERRWFALGYAHERAALYDWTVATPRPASSSSSAPGPRER